MKDKEVERQVNQDKTAVTRMLHALERDVLILIKETMQKVEGAYDIVKNGGRKEW